MRTLLTGAIALLSLAIPLDSVAQGAAVPAGSIAFISTQRISLETDDGKAGLARMQALQQEKSVDLRAKQQAIDTTRQRLTQATDASVVAQLQRQEVQQRTDLERAVAQAQAEAQTLQRQLNGELLAKVKAVLDDLLKGRNVQVVLNLETAVLWGSPALDLTGAVIERLNAKTSPPAK